MQLLLIGYWKPIRGKCLSQNKPTCENAVSQRLYGRCTLRVMGPWFASSSEKKKTASKSPVRKKNRPYCWRDKSWTRSSQSQREASVLQPTIKGKLLSLGERFIEEKRLAVEEKLAETAEKLKVLEDFYRTIKEAASETNLATYQWNLPFRLINSINRNEL